jgi:hypothetical protein
MYDEADISASQHEEKDNAWISKAYEHEEWTSRFEKEESERKKTPYRIVVRKVSAWQRGD